MIGPRLHPSYEGGTAGFACSIHSSVEAASCHRRRNGWYKSTAASSLPASDNPEMIARLGVSTGEGTGQTKPPVHPL